MLRRDAVVDHLTQLLTDRRRARRIAMARQRAINSLAYAIVDEREHATHSAAFGAAKPRPWLCDREAA